MSSRGSQGHSRKFPFRSRWEIDGRSANRSYTSKDVEVDRYVHLKLTIFPAAYLQYCGVKRGGQLSTQTTDSVNHTTAAAEHHYPAARSHARTHARLDAGADTDRWLDAGCCTRGWHALEDTFVRDHAEAEEKVPGGILLQFCTALAQFVSGSS